MMAIALGVLLGLAMTGSLHGFAQSDSTGPRNSKSRKVPQAPRPSSA